MCCRSLETFRIRLLHLTYPSEQLEESLSLTWRLGMWKHLPDKGCIWDAVRQLGSSLMCCLAPQLTHPCCTILAGIQRMEGWVRTRWYGMPWMVHPPKYQQGSALLNFNMSQQAAKVFHFCLQSWACEMYLFCFIYFKKHCFSQKYVFVTSYFLYLFMSVV